MENSTPLLIGVAGPSASGKTLLVKNLIESISESLAVLHEDSYYKDLSHLSHEQRSVHNYDHPDAFEHPLLCQHITKLKAGESIISPVYNFKTQTREKVGKHIAPAPVIIVEGILVLAAKELANALDLTIFVDTPLDICLIRRIERDPKERGRNLSEILKQYQATVRPMYYKYVEPSREKADIVVTGGGKNWKAIDVIKNQISKSVNGAFNGK